MENTDSQGEQKVSVKWDSQYQTPTTNEVTFNAYLCGGQVGDDDKANAAGDCIKIAKSNGKLYTGSPIVSFLQAIGYKYGDTQTENGTYGPRGRGALLDFH